MEFRILGPLEAWSGSQRLSLGGPRAECVVAMLLLEANHMVSVPRLVDAAWDEDPPATAAHQVRKIVAELRRRLPGGAELIVTDGAGYRTALSEAQLDLLVFEVRLRRAREAAAAGQPDNVITQLRAALELWQGPALAGLDTAVIRAAANVLTERRLAAADQLAELRLACGEAREVVPDLRELLSEQPLRETTRGQLMLALYRSGRQAEALQVYHEGRQLLAEELGIDPGPDLARLHDRILRNDPALAAPAPRPAEPPRQPPPMRSVEARLPRALPYDMADFVGRGEELDRIEQRARAPAGRGLTIVAIDGMAGVGKSSLMVHAAHRLAEAYPDGQFFIDLHGFTAGREPMGPAEALGILLRESGVAGERIPDDATARAALWRVQAAGRRLMLLLDNAVDAAQVRPLLPGAPGCLVMVTSRSRLAGLDGTLPLSLDLPSLDEGTELVARILGPDRVAGSGEDAEALVVTCGRLPLAIRIASARLHNRPQWSIGYLVERLQNVERQLRELSVDDRSVEAALGLSYDSLGPDHQRMFRLLGLLPNAEFGAYSAAALAEMPVGKAELILEDLLDARLITQRAQGRYTLHEIVRSYAVGVTQRTETGEQRAVARHRLFDFYLRAADAAADLVQPGRVARPLEYAYPPADIPDFRSRAAAMAWFDSECHSLLSAVRTAEANGLYQHACHLPRALAYYLQLRGRMQDLLGLLEVAVNAARRLGDGALEGRSLLNLSLPYWHLGRFHEALDCAEQALAIAADVDDQPAAGMCFGRIGTLMNGLGRYADALGYHERALSSYDATGLQREKGRTLASVSVAQAALGRYREALAAANQAVAIDRAVGDHGSEAISLINVATAHIGLGEYDAAAATLDACLSLARGAGTPNGEAVALARYADLRRRQGRYDEAVECGRQALRILWTIRRPAVAAAVENTLGSIHLARDECAAALDRHKRAHWLAEEVGFRIEVARALDGMAAARLALGDVDAAAEQWRLALAHYADMGVPEAASVRQKLAAARPPGPA